MAAVSIRALQREDTELIDFIKHRLAFEWNVPEREVEEEYVLPSFKAKLPAIFIAETENGEFAGKIFLSIEKNWFLGIDNKIWISALLVPEKFRGQGIAQQLIKQAEDTARTLGYTELYLDTKNAVPYYERLGGWKTLGTDYWKREEVTIMVKEL